MTIEETAFVFPCEGKSLVGVITGCGLEATRGVVIVVGGPQYRVGSHRQFTLLARHLAQAGIPVMRFDYRGMGDSEGDARGFDAVDADIRAAVGEFVSRKPSVSEVVLWGLCDAASAICFYSFSDPRVVGVALANPWVRTDEGAAKVRMKRYYARRILDPALWRKLIHAEIDWVGSVRDFSATLRRSVRLGGSRPSNHTEGGLPPPAACSLPERVRLGLQRFQGPVLLILSGEDLTAGEFEQVVAGSPNWKAILTEPHVEQWKLPEADHTFSRREWRDRVAARTAQWLRSW